MRKSERCQQVNTSKLTYETVRQMTVAYLYPAPTVEGASRSLIEPPPLFTVEPYHSAGRLADPSTRLDNRPVFYHVFA